MEMKRRSINKWVRSFSRRIGASVLHHPQFKWSAFTLFRFDAVHLSTAGNEYFRGKPPKLHCGGILLVQLMCGFPSSHWGALCAFGTFCWEAECHCFRFSEISLYKSFKYDLHKVLIHTL